MMTRTENPILNSDDALLIWVYLTSRLYDIRKAIDKLIKANRNAEDCLTLQGIRTNLDDADESAKDIGDWLGEIEQFRRVNPIVNKMTSRPRV